MLRSRDCRGGSRLCGFFFSCLPASLQGAGLGGAQPPLVRAIERKAANEVKWLLRLKDEGGAHRVDPKKRVRKPMMMYFSMLHKSRYAD